MIKKSVSSTTTTGEIKASERKKDVFCVRCEPFNCLTMPTFEMVNRASHIAAEKKSAHERN
jgi:hypothetical protein